MTSAGARRVLVDASLDVEVLRAGLRATAARVEPVDGSLGGDDVVGVVTWEHAVGSAELALGFEVRASDPDVPAGALAGAAVRPVSLDELLEGCHVVSLHAPLTAATAGPLGGRAPRTAIVAPGGG